MGGSVAAQPFNTFPKLLQRNAQQLQNRAASREKEFGIWQTWTWAEVNEETRAIAMGLVQLGLKAGDRVAIVGSNRPHLYWSIVSAQMADALPVPVYADASADEMAYVFEHSGARFAIVEDQEQVDKLLQINEEVKVLEQIIYLDPRGMRNYDHTAMHALEDVQKLGRANTAALGSRIDEIISRQVGTDTCVMLYTSGTTGRSKGVVLSNDNILQTAAGASEFDKLSANDETLAYLPMAWVGDFIFSMGQAYVSGFCVSCPESQDTLLQDLREIGPTFYFAPPRIFENLLTTVMIRMEDAGPAKKWLFHTFIDHAKKVGGDLLDGKPVGHWDRLLYNIGEALVYAPLKNSSGPMASPAVYPTRTRVRPSAFLRGA